MNALRRGCKPVALALLSASCASTPVHYHTLVPAPAGNPSVSVGPAYRIEIAPVRIPPQADRYELVVRRSDGGIALADGEVWVASLADELRSAFLVELTRQLGSPPGEQSATPPTVSLRLEVERFESALGRYVLLEATWRVRVKSAAGEQSLDCFSSAFRRVGDGYDALVLGDQRAVVAVADQIGLTVRQMATGSVAACPK